MTLNDGKTSLQVACSAPVDLTHVDLYKMRMVFGATINPLNVTKGIEGA